MSVSLRADRTRASASTDVPLVTGTVGVPVTVSLSAHYDGLQPTLVFHAGDESRDVALRAAGTGWERLDGGPVTVPHELMRQSGVTLEVGVYACDADGRVVIRTAPAQVATVRRGVRPCGIEPAQPTPSWAAQVQEAAAIDHRFVWEVQEVGGERRLVLADRGGE